MNANDDIRYLAAAIRLGTRWRGASGPNPAVGALLVRDDGRGPRIVGRGATARGGRPHAEALALDEAGELARGATAYVSLEPCAHHGQTPPCALRLVEAGIARVVTAIEDPDPRVAGRGHAILREAGIEVVTGVLQDEAERALRGFLTRIRLGRPAVTLKLAVSRDGMIAGPGGRTVAITGPEALAASHMLRATHDAILVGIGTALADDPRLTCRLPGVADRSPARVVLDTRLRLPADSKLLADAPGIPLHVFAGPDAPEEAEAALVASGATVHRIGGADEGAVPLLAVLERLAEEGGGRVLVEGGAAVYRSVLEADLADEVVVFRAPREIGSDGLAALPPPGVALFEDASKYRRLTACTRGGDEMLLYERAGIFHE